jgi:two-component system OmpR family response regulator
VRPVVLVVDDDHGIREMVRMALVAEGYRVDTASNGDAALAVLRLARPDLVLLDISMPVMDGWTFRALQLQMPDARDVPVLIVSGNERLDPPSAELAPVAVLRKPYELDQLVATVRTLVPLPSGAAQSTDAAAPEPAPPLLDPAVGTQPA